MNLIGEETLLILRLFFFFLGGLNQLQDRDDLTGEEKGC